MGFIPGLGRCPHAVRQPSPCTTASKACRPWSLNSATREVNQNEGPNPCSQGVAPTVITRESLCPANEDPAQTKQMNKYVFKLKKIFNFTSIISMA